MANVVPINPRDRGLPRPLLRKVVGDVLRRHRRRQRRTLADVADGARVSVQYLSEVERGRKEASSEVLAAVCGSLRIDLPDLLEDAARALVADRLAADRVAAGRTPMLRLGLVGGSQAAPVGPVATPVHRPGDAMLLAA